MEPQQSLRQAEYILDIVWFIVQAGIVIWILALLHSIRNAAHRKKEVLRNMDKNLVALYKLLGGQSAETTASQTPPRSDGDKEGRT